MKNILFLSSWFPSKVHSTLGNFVKYHAHSVAKFNNIYVLYIVADDTLKNYKIESFKEENLLITIVYFKRGIFKYFNYWNAFLKGLHFLMKEKAIEFDLVHMNIMHPGIWQALYLYYKHQLPFIVSENWHGFQDLSRYKLSRLQYFLIKKGFKKSNFICPVSIQLQDCMKKAGYSANYKIIPNVVNTSTFNIGEKKTLNSFTFLHVSTLEDSIKNVTGIIDAFDKVNIPNAFLKIIGDGPTHWISEKVNNLKLSNSIIVKGKMNHKDISKEMQKANAFVLFSNIENLPLVLIESMACGTPFIASNVGGVAELHNDDVGVLVESGNSKELTFQMDLLYRNYKKYDAKIIRQHAINHYSEEVVGKQFNDLYIEIL